MPNPASMFTWTPLSTVVWLLWVCPLVLVGGLWLCLKPRSQHGAAFVILGTLIGYGVQLVVNHFVVQLSASVPKNLSEGEELVAILRINGYRALLISLACSVPLIL